MPLIRWAFKVLYTSIIGGISIFLLNLVLGLLGYHIALNAVTALLAGSLGIPGVVLIVFLQNMF